MSEHDLLDERDPLLDEVAVMFRLLDPMPDHVMVAAMSAPEVISAWRDLDSGLLEILADSAVQPVAAGMRSGGGPRLVTFGDNADCTVEVEVGVEPAGTLRLVGLVLPTGPGELEVRHPAGAKRVPVDELGRFRAEGVPAGPLSFVLHPNGERTATTDWITV
jgi:hypothetical protein